MNKDAIIKGGAGVIIGAALMGAILVATDKGGEVDREILEKIEQLEQKKVENFEKIGDRINKVGEPTVEEKLLKAKETNDKFLLFINSQPE